MSRRPTTSLPTTREAALRWYGEVLEKAAQQSAEHLLEARRWLCRNDLFYLLVVGLHRIDANRDWLFARCREVQDSPDEHLDLWARAHYKSTIITFALTIQEILCDPEVTIGIFSDTNKVAKPFLKQIKREFETNQDLKDWFPDILWQNPAKEAPKWSEDDGIIVRRKANPKEATVEAYGLLDGQPTGRHFTLLLFDDVVTIDTVTTPETIAKVKERFALAENLGSERARHRYVGTRYHANDAYAELMRTGEVKVRIHTATVDGTDAGAPVFLTPKALAKKRRKMGPYVFACQMLQNPTADKAQGFHEKWLKYWNASSVAGLNIYILVDPASGKRADKKNDYTSMWVVGLGGDGNWYVIDGVRARLNLTKRCQHLMRLHRQYRPLRVGYESYGLQADIEHIQDVMDRTNYRFDIVELGGQLKKTDRIKRLVPEFEQGKVFFPYSLVRQDETGATVDLTRQFVEDEYLMFPVSRFDDMLDCLSRICDDEVMGFQAPTPRAEQRERDSFQPNDDDDDSRYGWMTG